MQISILSGAYSDQQADFRTSYPVNCVAVPLKNDISNGYLRVADGIREVTTTGMPAGASRGGINWNGTLYRVMGSKLVSINSLGVVTTIGDVGAGPQCSLDYSFDRLAVAAGGGLYYFNGGTLTQVADPDLGVVVDFIWIDGYFMTTDGENLVVTELNDPNAVDPLKYGSSEADPDRVVGLLKIRNEAYALNRYTIEVFNNIGGDNFPFVRVDGAIIPKGCVGTHAKCSFDGTFAFLGSGRNEPCSVYLADSANPVKIATREIETIIQKYSEEELAGAILEYRENKTNKLVYVRLPNETLVYDLAATTAIGIPVWYFAASNAAGTGPFRAKDYVYCYGGYQAADYSDNRLGVFDSSINTQYGQIVGGQFDTQIVYNASKGVIVNQIEIVGLFGRAELGDDPVIFVSWTNDGETWSDERRLRIGKQGQRDIRPQIRQSGRFGNWRAYRIRWANSAVASYTRLEADLEPLNYG
jgi:hypothetical protein